jgi:hypothetical protein
MSLSFCQTLAQPSVNCIGAPTHPVTTAVAVTWRMRNNTICPNCKSKMDRNVTYIDPTSAIRSSSKEGYVKETVTYMVMDDLEVKPLSTTIVISLLTKFNVNVNELGAIEERVVDLGKDEVWQSIIISNFRSVHYNF